VTADGGAFVSATLGDGGTFSHRFASTGTFEYHCAIHPSMTGTVIVSD
jgi:plastocyanin